MKTIQLSNGMVAFVDDEDFEKVAHISWSASKHRKTFYATYSSRKIKIKMHRMILGLSDPLVLCDHIDGNGLNNQKSNLRICSNAENLRNRGKNKNNTSGYKGVFKKRNKWTAQINFHYKTIRVGTFDTPELAHHAYCEKAKQLHGEFFNHGLTEPKSVTVSAPKSVT